MYFNDVAEPYRNAFVSNKYIKPNIASDIILVIILVLINIRDIINAFEMF